MGPGTELPHGEGTELPRRGLLAGPKLQEDGPASPTTS